MLFLTYILRTMTLAVVLCSFFFLLIIRSPAADLGLGKVVSSTEVKLFIYISSFVSYIHIYSYIYISMIFCHFYPLSSLQRLVVREV